MFRFSGLLALAGAFAAAVLDAARTVADQRLEFTPGGRTLATLFPTEFAELPALAGRIHPKLWDPVLVSMLYAPTALDLMLIGAALIMVTRRRADERPIGARR